MSLVPFADLLANARRGRYAVGYFESWSLESLLAVADAAEAQRAPVVLGFSGVYLPHPRRKARDPLGTYAAMALSVCRSVSVPAALMFNESPNRSWCSEAVRLGFNAVMYSNDADDPARRLRAIADLVTEAHAAGAAVEAEMESLAGVAGDLRGDTRQEVRPTEFGPARAFVDDTGVDALAVNVGQIHLHGRSMVRLDFDRIKRLAELAAPLVLHGATSVRPDDLARAAELGVAKVNVGSRLKQAYFEAMRRATVEAGDHPVNPYEIIGSGLTDDVLMSGRLAMQGEVERFMILFGSSGRART
jgi:fructose/tagatose bisphosphate aldolase